MTKRARRQKPAIEDRTVAVGDRWFVEAFFGVDDLPGHVAVVRRRDGHAACLSLGELEWIEELCEQHGADRAAEVLTRGDVRFLGYYKATYAQTAFKDACVWVPPETEQTRRRRQAVLDRFYLISPLKDPDPISQT